MRKCVLAAAAAALTMSAPAVAQSYIVNDVIAQTISGMNSGMPDGCFTDRWAPKPKGILAGTERAELGMAAYLQLAAAGMDVNEAYTYAQDQRVWKLDGVQQDPRTVRDPWAAKVARLERTDLRVGNGEFAYRGLWRAFAADGTLLGTYEAYLIRKKGGSRLAELALHSPGNGVQPEPATPFCAKPGDIEEREAAIAKRKAEKAARRAAREAARAGGQN